MSPGKIAAQAAHAAVEGFRLTPPDSNLLRLWYRSGHYKKIVLLGKNESHMRNAYDYVTDRDIAAAKIIDEGRTEIESLSLTAIGCELVDKHDPHIAGIFEAFELYKEEAPPYFNPETAAPYIAPPIPYGEPVTTEENIWRRPPTKWKIVNNKAS
jgi:peptidyl-tRNA hydrolase